MPQVLTFAWEQKCDPVEMEQNSRYQRLGEGVTGEYRDDDFSRLCHRRMVTNDNSSLANSEQLTVK